MSLEPYTNSNQDIITIQMVLYRLGQDSKDMAMVSSRQQEAWNVVWTGRGWSDRSGGQRKERGWWAINLAYKQLSWYSIVA
jgi:hypothetical protein